MFGQHRVRRQQGVEEVSVKGCGTVSNSCCSSHGLISAPAHPVSPTLSSHFFIPPSHFSSIILPPQSFPLQFQRASSFFPLFPPSSHPPFYRSITTLHHPFQVPARPCFASSLSPLCLFFLLVLNVLLSAQVAVQPGSGLCLTFLPLILISEGLCLSKASQMNVHPSSKVPKRAVPWMATWGWLQNQVYLCKSPCWN